jgi:hypothetical protein
MGFCSPTIPSVFDSPTTTSLQFGSFHAAGEGGAERSVNAEQQLRVLVSADVLLCMQRDEILDYSVWSGNSNTINRAEECAGR